MPTSSKNLQMLLAWHGTESGWGKLIRGTSTKQSAVTQLEQKIKALVRKAKILDAQEDRRYGKRSCCPRRR